jgi:transcriptional regulator with XRE-family HTH domain
LTIFDNPHVLKAIGSRLREERKRLNLNQTEMGRAGGVAKDAQINYEAGIRKPDAGYLAGIDSAGFDVLYVITGRRDLARNGELTEEEAELLSAYRGMDLVGRAGLMGMVRGMQAQRGAETTASRKKSASDKGK